MDLDGKGIDPRELWLRHRPWVAATLSLFALYAWYVWSSTDFRDDDLDHFLLMQKVGFWQFLSMPIDVHHTPLHRLLTWLVYRASPMSFLPPLLIMLVLHGATLIYLYRSLRLIGAGGSADVVVCCYAASILVVFTMLWWAHAQHRMPYVLLDTFAVYHYLTWLKRGRPLELGWSFLGILLAFGFYEKAALIPLHMLVLGACAFPSDFRPVRFGVPGRHSSWGAVGGVFAEPAARQLRQFDVRSGRRPAERTGVHQDARERRIRNSARSGFRAKPFRAVRTPDVHRHRLGQPFLPCLWRSRTAGILWIVMLATLVVDYLPIALSNRIAIFRGLILSQYRFHYEELHVVALFMGVIGARVRVARSAADRSACAC